MRIPRIHHPIALTPCKRLELSSDGANHVARVLRMARGELLHLFDGSNQIFPAHILMIDKKKVVVQLEQGIIQDQESPLYLHLGQVISRGERMEFTVQKAVELGVNAITPLTSERCGVKLAGERLEKKVEQWRKIAIAACEQCGRNRIPAIYPPLTLQEWCQQVDSQQVNNELKLTLHPQASNSIASLPESVQQIKLLIGPEGGLSTEEIKMTHQYHFTDILLGPRTLRTETAALAAITALQVRFGDLG